MWEDIDIDYDDPDFDWGDVQVEPWPAPDSDDYSDPYYNNYNYGKKDYWNNKSND